MGRKEMYLVRDGAGRMHTIIAQSERGAVNAFIQQQKPPRGDDLSVKPRGHGDWQFFTVT